MKRISDEEIDAIQITQDDKDELEGMAAIGLVDCVADHEEYARRVPYLLEQRLKSKTAQAQLEACEKEHDAEVKEICEFLILCRTNLLDVQRIANGSYKRALKEKYL